MTADPAPILRMRGIRKSFGSAEVLRGIDLDVASGEVVVLIGASGSGKTSLLRCINLLNVPTAGRIEVDATVLFDTKSASSVSRAALCRQRARIGMVFQQFNLFPHMTVLANVMEGPVTVLRESRAIAATKAHALLARLGLETHADKRPAQLSGGQQQRVAIARALAMQPALMLFDEPTSALDPELVGEVLQAIRDLARDGMTMVIVTHELGFAYEIADRVVFMEAGEIAEVGPAQELLLRPNSPRLQAFVARFHEMARALSPMLHDAQDRAPATIAP